MNAKDYIKYLLSVESYSFSFEEIINNTEKTETALKFELVRLIQKKEIFNLRKGFYLIVPPRYSGNVQIPVQLYIDKLFEYLKRKYYVGFFSAARFYGAGHQQIQKDYVMTEKPKMNDIRKNNFEIRFLTATNWAANNVVKKKSDAGFFKISDPALTAVDLIHYQMKLGGLNKILTVLEELVEQITIEEITKLLSWYPYKSTLQRLGFLFEKMDVDKELINALKEYLQQLRLFPVLLSHQVNRKPGVVDNFWKVDVNIKPESDL